MVTEYVLAKFIHILVAILALGTSAGLGIVLEFYGDDRMHGPFVLRAIQRLLAFFVIPGYALMLLTGLWMVHLTWPLTTKWVQAALALWAIGLVLMGASATALHKQIGLSDTGAPASSAYRSVSLLARGLGAGAGLMVVVILYLMVVKPELAFLPW